MNETSGIDMATIYEHTAAILGTAALIMGATLLMLRRTLISMGIRSKSGLVFLSIAMFILSFINLLEYTMGVGSQSERYSLSVVVFAASTELFLIYMAYMSMLCNGFATRMRICVEIGCIVVFTTPALFVSPTNQPMLSNGLFALGIAFYCIKFLANYIIYRRQMRETTERVKNLLSDDSRLWLRWINSSYHVVLIIAIASIVVPMTNLTVLVFYNSFLLFAYFYIYLLVIQKIFVFDRRMAIVESDEMRSNKPEYIEESSAPPDVCPNPVVDFIDSRQGLINEWIAAKGYAVAGITAAEVASHLKTNRVKLSSYLKNNLNTTYYDWIAHLRIEDAKRQLVEYPDRTIYEIAMNVGIEDRDNFRHVFQKIVGTSPTAYRKQQQNGTSPLTQKAQL